MSHHFFKDQDTVYLNQRINNDENALTTFFIDILPKIVLSYFNAQLSSLRFFLSLGKQYQENLVSYSRMDALLSIPTLDFGSQPLHTIEKIELRSVGFSYDADRKIFSNLSLTLEKGSVYYVKGANGTGKSTLIDILTGLYPNEYGGEIIFNGHINMRELDIKYYQANLLAYLDQDATLMNDSLLNNMTLAKAPSEYLDFYCSAIGLDELIDKLPEGLHATVNNHSKNLSGGERQKISIIRQFVKNAEVLIFDEPTSALDKYSKSRFWNLIESIKVDKIILVITHDKEQTLPQGEVIFLDDSAPHRSHSVS